MPTRLNCKSNLFVSIVLKHNLDPHYIALVLIALPLTYILIGVAEVTFMGIQLGILASGTVMYTCTFAMWCVTVPKVPQEPGKAILNTVQVVRMQRAPVEDEKF